VLPASERIQIHNRTVPSLGAEITVTRNSIGFRGPEPPADSASYLTVFTMGGSVAQGFYLSDGDTWTARLGSRLSGSFRRVWINNAALDSQSTRGNLAMLEDYVRKFHPKVILFHPTNDVVTDESPGVGDGENVKGPLVFRTPTTLIRTLSPYSELAGSIADLERRWDRYRHGVLHHAVDLRQWGTVESSEEFRSAFLARYAGIHLSGYGDRLRRLIQLCREAQITPVLVTEPNLVGFGVDDVTQVDLARVAIEDFPGVNGKLFWDLHEMYNQMVRRVAREQNVILIDLAKELPKSSRLFYDYVHFTNAGAQAAGDIAYRNICPALDATFSSYRIGPCLN
jgi:lysophospholipase L1-like esterase